MSSCSKQRSDILCNDKPFMKALLRVSVNNNRECVTVPNIGLMSSQQYVDTEV